MLNIPDKISRPGFRESYLANQHFFLAKMSRDDPAKIGKFLEQVYNEDFKDRKTITRITRRPGDLVTKEVSLLDLFEYSRTKILTPSGSAFHPPYEFKSLTAEMVHDAKVQRGKYKKQMFKAQEEGNELLQGYYSNMQNSAKIFANAISGGFASPYNALYDKGAYNGTTSTCRSGVCRSYTMAEQLIGGNFIWMSEDELINHIVVVLRHMPDPTLIDKVIEHFHLTRVDHHTLYDFYAKTIKTYYRKKIPIVEEFLTKLTSTEICYLYYHCNLRHIMWNHRENFIRFIDDLWKTDAKIEDLPADTKVEEVFEIDDTYLLVVNMSFPEIMQGCGISKALKEHPERVLKLIAMTRAIQLKIDRLNALADIFIHSANDIPTPINKPNVWRNSTLMSDTDSVMVTASAWDEWYRGEYQGIDIRAYQIGSLVAFWLSHALKSCMFKYSCRLGCTGDNTKLIELKNEFFYVGFNLLPIKKTYAALQAIQEGIAHKELEADIKGQLLKGSSYSPKMVKFIEHFAMDRIIKPALNGKQSGMNLIKAVVDMEMTIINSVRSGKGDYFKITSVNTADSYKDEDRISAYNGWVGWQAIFAHNYGDIQPPVKTYLIPIIRPDQPTIEKVNTINSKIAKKMVEFFNTNTKSTNLISNLNLDYIPKEFLPLIDIRKVVYQNMSAIYMLLESLNITIGYSKEMMIFSDIYGDNGLKL